MRRSDLVDATVPMAAFFERLDEAHPEEVLKRRQDAARELLGKGFSHAEVEALYGADAVPATVGRLRASVAGSAIREAEERTMADRDNIKATIELFCNAVNGSADAR